MTGNVGAIVLAYFIGAIPMGLVLGKVLKGVDIRDYGSGKIGASNVLRSLGAKATAFVLLFDISKGVAAIFLAKGLGDALYVEALAGIAAMAGHNWSIFIRFSGGRGVSTSLGGLFAIAPIWAVVAMGTGVLVIGLTRYVSVGSMTGAIVAVVALLVLAVTGHEPWEYFAYAATVVSFIVFQHRGNIVRLVKRKERRLGDEAERREAVGAASDSG